MKALAQPESTRHQDTRVKDVAIEICHKVLQINSNKHSSSQPIQAILHKPWDYCIAYLKWLFGNKWWHVFKKPPIRQDVAPASYAGTFIHMYLLQNMWERELYHWKLYCVSGVEMLAFRCTFTFLFSVLKLILFTRGERHTMKSYLLVEEILECFVWYTRI